MKKAKSPRARTPEAEVLVERKMDAEKRGARTITGPRREHDKNTCRLYGCLQCKSDGVKNEKRGLK